MIICFIRNDITKFSLSYIKKTRCLEVLGFFCFITGYLCILISSTLTYITCFCCLLSVFFSFKNGFCCSPYLASRLIICDQNGQISMDFWSSECNMFKCKFVDTVKTVLSGHSKRRPKLFFKTNCHLMQIKSIAECSKGSILDYFQPSSSYHLPLFMIFLVISIFHQKPIFVNIIAHFRSLLKENTVTCYIQYINILKVTDFSAFPCLLFIPLNNQPKFLW